MRAQLTALALYSLLGQNSGCSKVTKQPVDPLVSCRSKRKNMQQASTGYPIDGTLEFIYMFLYTPLLLWSFTRHRKNDEEQIS